MPDAEKEKLVRLCERQRIAVIEDDTYGALGPDDIPLKAAKAWDRDGSVIYCASLRKTLAPGLRLGWVAGGRWQARIHMIKYAQSRANEILAQFTVAEFMSCYHWAWPACVDTVCGTQELPGSRMPASRSMVPGI